MEDLGTLNQSPLQVLDLGTASAGRSIPVSFPRVMVGIFEGSVLRAAPFGVDIALCTQPTDQAGWVQVDDLNDALAILEIQAGASPIAALTLAQLMRMRPHLDFEAALAAESLAYATLQSGSVFTNWLHQRPVPKARVHDGDAVLVTRNDDAVTLTLNRPAIHNAMSVELRDGLCEALSACVLDHSISSIVLKGAGKSFSSGGFLDEFGTLPDPATGHAVRMTRSNARLMHQLTPRLRVELHGAAMGAGIELGCLGQHVTAAADTVIALPEVALGLVPGAGGTASLPMRIGPQRCCWLGMSGTTIDAPKALAWGLIDEVTP
jgi:enoyl-CoA hydratase